MRQNNFRGQGLEFFIEFPTMSNAIFPFERLLWYDPWISRSWALPSVRTSGNDCLIDLLNKIVERGFHE